MKKPWEFDNPLCAEIGPDFFYMEEDGKMRSAKEYRQIRALCQSCAHVFDCAEWGIAKENFGVWGGLTPRERSLVRRQRRLGVLNEKSLSVYLSKTD